MPVIATAYFPFDAGAGANVTEAQWRKMGRFYVPTSVMWDYSLLKPFGDSTGLQAKVDTGAAHIQGHYGEWTSGVSVLGLAAVGGIAGGSERWDRLISRADFVNNRLELDVLTGTAGASPNSLRPGLTQSSSVWELLLADVGPLINTTTTITAGMVVDGRWFTRNGGVPFYWATPSGVSSVLLPSAGAIPSLAGVGAARLRLLWKIRTTSGNALDNLTMRFNGSSSAIYDYQQFQAASTTLSGLAATSQTSFAMGQIPGGAATANFFAQGSVDIVSYDDSVHKTFTAESWNSTQRWSVAGQWNSTVALTSISLLLSAGNFASGSVIALEVT